jgi:hypothetical protein
MRQTTIVAGVLIVFALFILIKFTQDAREFVWIYPDNVIVPTIFFQGITESQLQVMRYISDELFKSTTGEMFKRSATKYIPIIHTPWIHPELPEIVPYQEDRLSPFFTKKIDNFFHQLTEKRRHDADVCQHEDPEGCIPQETLSKYSLRLDKVNLAQRDDITSHFEKYRACLDHFGSTPLILHGVSRGAATTFNALCSHAALYKEHVKAAILESPFDSIPEIFRQRFPYKHRIITWLLSCCTNYDNNGPAPIQLVASFPEHIPVLFVTSKTDVMVPLERTDKLARVLASKKCNDVYLLVLSGSRHARYAFDNKEDAALYRDVVHAFYKAHGLPHIPRYASNGLEKLAESKLT